MSKNLAEEMIDTECRLASGGPVMKIVRIDAEGNPVCQWIDEDRVEHEHAFPFVCLVRAEG